MAIQLAYHWLIFIKLVRYKPANTAKASTPVSIVIAARNEAHNLKRLIPALMTQDYDAFEVVVVDDRSTDHSVSLLQDYARKYPRLKVIHIYQLPAGWTGKKHAISQGISATSHELLLLTDADCLPNSSQWISEMTAGFSSQTDIVLGFSPYEKGKGWLNQFIQFETLHTALQYLSYALAGRPYMGVGRNLAYRKSLFTQAGFGGDEQFTGGDDDIFVNRHASGQNTAIVISPESQMISLPKKTWPAYFRQKIRHLSAGKRYHKKDQTRLGAFALATLVGWLLFIYLLFGEHSREWILILFGCRSLSFYSIFTRSGQKLNVKLAYWALPLLDLCYTISYPVVALMALTAKRIKWS